MTVAEPGKPINPLSVPSAGHRSDAASRQESATGRQSQSFNSAEPMRSNETEW